MSRFKSGVLRKNKKDETNLSTTGNFSAYCNPHRSNAIPWSSDHQHSNCTYCILQLYVIRRLRRKPRNYRSSSWNPRFWGQLHPCPWRLELQPSYTRISLVQLRHPKSWRNLSVPTDLGKPRK